MFPDAFVLVLYACIVGATIGSISGLIPGIHVNTLAALILAFHESLEAMMSLLVPPDQAPVLLACCVMSAAVVHSATDFVPSVFFGVPDPDNVTNILPGHSMLLEGHGMTAVRCAAMGSLVGAFVSITLSIPIFYMLSNGLGDYLDSLTIGVLVSVLVLMVVKEQKGRKWVALALIIASGTLGCITMNIELPLTNVFGMEPESMFPMLSGFFGIPALILTSPSGSIPEQDDPERFPVGPVAGLKGVITGSVIGWFPGVTSSCGASVAGSIFGEENRRGYISMVSSIGTSATMFTFIALAVSGKERSGTMSVVAAITDGTPMVPGTDIFACMLVTMALASLLAYFVMIRAGKAMCLMTEMIDLRVINMAILIMMVVLTLLLTGYWGFVLLLLCTFIGLIPIVLDSNRMPLTGCLIVPVLLFKLGLM